MSNFDRISLFVVFISLLSACSRPESPEGLLQRSQEKYFSSMAYSYNTTLIYPHPMFDEVDTFRYELQFEKHPNELLDYNFIGISAKNTSVYQDNTLTLYIHKDSTVQMLDADTLRKSPDRLMSNMQLAFSPLKILKNGDLLYKGDTAIQNKTYRLFYKVLLDKVFEETKVYSENQVLINPANAQIALIRHLLFHDDKPKQFIDAWFDKQEFFDNPRALEINLHQGYVTATNDKKKSNRKLLQPGKNAPDFLLSDLEGNKVNLKDYRGKRVLLDFSMINCGFCKHALDHFNKADFSFASDVEVFYINPVDSLERMQMYVEKVNIPFTVLLSSDELAALYGVSGYPSFFILDEKGTITDAFAGYFPEKFEGLRESL